jgi:hypothetical protein
MTPRSIRRAAERRARKLERKQERALAMAAPPDEAIADPCSDRTFPASDGPSPAQLLANRANAQSSTGPKTDAGKAVSSLNNFRHGLAGKFMVLDWESREEFNDLLDNLHAEHQPATPTETLLVEGMAQHYWLRQRALRLQHCTMDQELPTCGHPKELALYLRYQTTHERAFQKCLSQLLTLRAQKRKIETGFESQARKRREEVRKEAGETRKQELHKWNVLLVEAKVDHRVLLNHNVATAENRPAVGPERILTAQKAA